MKKFILASVSAIALLGVAACSDSGTDKSTTQSTNPPAATEQPMTPTTPDATAPKATPPATDNSTTQSITPAPSEPAMKTPAAPESAPVQPAPAPAQ